MKIISRVKIYVYGRELYRFINRIHEEKIYCTDQFCRKDVFCGSIFRRDLHRVRELSSELGLRLRYTEPESLFSIQRRYRLRIGAFMGTAVILLFAAYFSGTVVSIDIQGNERISDQVILSALEELDITCGTPMRDIDFELTENRLRLMVEGLSWAGLHRSGSRLVVKVTEVRPRPDMIPYRTPCNVVASETARIVSTVVRDGRLMHVSGETVPKGTLLISGVTTDELGHTLLHHAMGDITGIYKRQISFSAPYEQTVRKSSGRTKNVRRLKIFGAEIPLFSGNCHFPDSEVNTSERILLLFGKKLPLSVINHRYTELVTVDAVLSEEELEAELIGKVYLYEKNFLSDKEILERNISYSSTEEAMTVTADYRLKGDICETRELFVK